MLIEWLFDGKTILLCRMVRLLSKHLPRLIRWLHAKLIRVECFTSFIVCVFCAIFRLSFALKAIVLWGEFNGMRKEDFLLVFFSSLQSNHIPYQNVVCTHSTNLLQYGRCQNDNANAEMSKTYTEKCLSRCIAIDDEIPLLSMHVFTTSVCVCLVWSVCLASAYATSNKHCYDCDKRQVSSSNGMRAKSPLIPLKTHKIHIKYANLTDWRNLILFMRHR